MLSNLPQHGAKVSTPDLYDGSLYWQYPGIPSPRGRGRAGISGRDDGGWGRVEKDNASATMRESVLNFREEIRKILNFWTNVVDPIVLIRHRRLSGTPCPSVLSRLSIGSFGSGSPEARR